MSFKCLINIAYNYFNNGQSTSFQNHGTTDAEVFHLLLFRLQ